MNPDYKYCIDSYQYSRRKTRIVTIGDVPMGGDYPIRIQSMTNINTLNTMKCVEQCIRIIRAGADYVRLTTQNIKEAQNLAIIKEKLRSQGYNTPLIADVHFNPDVAEMAAKIVEKVRINPGNYISYKKEIYRGSDNNIKEKLRPLLHICKQYNTVLRIGVNHGSLSERIINDYGNTPEGMVESAMEFLRICVEEEFMNVVISMKSSNTHIMVQSTRLLVQKMFEETMDFPIHLGVTESGEGQEGRIKSAAGIGTLLRDGIGDTIRISLTEEPEYEIPVAKDIVRYFFEDKSEGISDEKKFFVHPFEYTRRQTNNIDNIGSNHVPIVVAEFGRINKQGLKLLNLSLENNQIAGFSAKTSIPDYIYITDIKELERVPSGLKYILEYESWRQIKDIGIECFPILSVHDYLLVQNIKAIHFICINYNNLTKEVLKVLKRDGNAIIVIDSPVKFNVYEARAIFNTLSLHSCKAPVVIRRVTHELDPDLFQLNSTFELAPLFIDGVGDGIWLTGKGSLSTDMINDTAFMLLQACRSRMSKTEFISCPSCGRTHFDIQRMVRQIKKRLAHLKNVKIAVMGCIVNGPGEMADADYGYVGSGKNKVTIYKSKNPVKKNMSETDAIEYLVKLIKDDGKWISKV